MRNFEGRWQGTRQGSMQEKYQKSRQVNMQQRKQGTMPECMK